MTERAGAVPLLVARDLAKRREGSRGAILWYHGFGVDKETHRSELARFARAGFVAVGVDVVGHGERAAPDLEARKQASQADAFLSVVEFARATAAETPALVDYVVMNGHAGAPDRVALSGISMGAFVVYGAALADPRVTTAVAILGSPEWPGSNSPHTQIARLCNTRLLSIVGECDVNVPPAAARRLHEQLDTACSNGCRRFLELPGAEHLMKEPDWERTMDETIRWISEKL